MSSTAKRERNFTLRGAQHEAAPAGELRLAVAAGGFERATAALRAAGARFVSVFKTGASAATVAGVFALEGELVMLSAPFDSGTLTRLGDAWPAASWAARELAERNAPEAAREPFLTAPDASRLDGRLSGLDVFTIPYGPVRSGIFEAIQFQIETGGEDVPAIQTRPFFKHRGLEARFAGLPPDRAIYVGERVAGIASVAYACAFSQAVERAVGVTPPPRAERWRAVYCELERLACHLDVIAKEAETTALYVGQARFQILKEQVVRMRARLTGSRFARGVICPGGVRFEGLVELDELLATVDALERDLRRDRRLFTATASMTDRLIGSGRLPRNLVEEYSAVGPLARGSGVSTDARHERPYGDYQRLGLQVVTRPEGDAMARINVRFGELAESLRLLRGSIDQLRRQNGALCVPLPGSRSGSAFGWVEAPQGELVIWVEIRRGIVRNVHIASPSLRNWALFDHAFPKDVLTDFAFIEHSFGLTSAGADR
ncbi:MAG: NADH-quinone oxidoreductase subunit D [Solirubrobacteraceae bacterium]|jgi:Ni,Fe-hydrogenase III large subunit